MKTTLTIHPSKLSDKPRLYWSLHPAWQPDTHYFGWEETPEACILAANKLGYNFAVPGEALPAGCLVDPFEEPEGILDRVCEKLNKIEALALKLQASVQAKDNLIAQLEADITTKDRMLRECKRAIGYHFNPLVNRDLAHNNLMTVIHDLRYY